jgi:hypothetical protein
MNVGFRCTQANRTCCTQQRAREHRLQGQLYLWHVAQRGVFVPRCEVFLESVCQTLAVLAMSFGSTHSKLHGCRELGVRVGAAVRSSDCWCVEALRLQKLGFTRRRKMGRSRGKWCGDIEIDGYPSDPVGPVSLVLDLCITLTIIITLLTLSPICLL